MTSEAREAIRRRLMRETTNEFDDIEWVQHAREDIPTLLAEIERLNAMIDRRIVAIAAFETWMNIPEGVDWIEAVSAAIDRAFKNGEARGRARAAEDGQP